jgi:membrane protease YdiL (CAAX protease family)
MTPPPVLPEGESIVTPLPRLKIAWVILFCIFGLLVYGSIDGAKSSKAPTPKKTDVVGTMEKMLGLKLAMRSVPGTAPKNQERGFFEAEIEQLLPEAKTKPEAQRLRAVLRIEDGEKPFGDDLKNLAASKRAEDQAFAKLLETPKPDRAEANKLLSSIGTKTVADKLLQIQTLEKLGDKNIRQKTFPFESSLKYLLLFFAFASAFVIGLVMWGYYFINRRLPAFWPRGMLFSEIDKGRADRLALAASIIIGVFVLGLEVAAYLKIAGIAYLAIFVAIGAIFYVPIAGYRIRPSDLGLTTRDLGSQIGWGFATALANVPVLVVSAMFMLLLKDLLPGGGHPVSEQLMNDRSPGSILKLLLLAAVVAPIWEEIVFRGLIFPGLAKISSPIIGAITSSLLFAAIHPQGAIGVIPLGLIAMMCCGATYQRRSVIPNIVFHALNNAGVLVISLLIADMM